MPIDIATLRTEAQLAKYARQTPAQIAAAINAESVSVDRDVPVIEARKVVLPTGELAKIKVFAETRPVSGTAAPAIIAAISFVETMADRESVIPASAKGQVDTMLGGLVAATVLTQASKDALMALFASTMKRSKQLFGEDVAEGHVARALA